MARASSVQTKSIEVGRCPACERNISAEVTYSVTLGNVQVVDGEAKVDVSTKVKRCVIDHRCEGDKPGPTENAPNL